MHVDWTSLAKALGGNAASNASQGGATSVRQGRFVLARASCTNTQEGAQTPQIQDASMVYFVVTHQACQGRPTDSATA